MQKILVIHNKYRIFGGEDSNILDEIEILKKEYEIEYLEFDNSKKLKFLSFFYLFSSNNLSSNKLLKRKLKMFQPDFVYVHNTWFTANLGIFKILQKNNIKTILKIHNFRYECSRYFKRHNHLKNFIQCPMCGYSRKGFFNKYFTDSYIKSFFMILYGKKYFKILINNNLAILVLNKFHLEKIIEYGVPEEKVSIIHNPVLVNEQKINVYDPNSNYIIYAGSLTDSKGLNELINTFEIFQDSNLTLKVVGDGPLKDTMVSCRNKKIEYIGVLNNFKTLELISNSRAVVTFTKMYEGQPRLLNEASALGVPSIYPDFGGISEYFPNGYPLSFKQFDYFNANEKFLMLKDLNLLKLLSSQVVSFTNRKLGEDAILNNYKKVFNDY